MTLHIICLFIGALICLAAPAAAAVVMIIKRKGKWYMFVLGVASFTVSQLLIRIPLLGELQNAAWYNMFMITQGLLCMLLVAFSAGVFEETGRYVALKLIKRDLLTWENGLMFGLGHGGVEAFWIAGLPYANAITDILAGKNTAAYMLIPPADLLMGSVERILAIAMHIGFTMLVLYAVKRRKVWCFLLAILAHGLVDITIPLLQRLSGWALEGIFAVFAILAVVLTIKIKPAINSDKNAKAEITQAKEG